MPSLEPQRIGDHTIRAMEASDFTSTLKLFERIFQQSEPVATHLGLRPSAMKTMTDSSFYRTLVEDGLTAIVEHEPTNEIVGFRLAGDLAHQTAPGLQERFEQGVVQLMDRFPRMVSTLTAPFYTDLFELLAYNQLDHMNMDRWLCQHLPSEQGPLQRGMAVKMAGLGLLSEHRGRGFGGKLIAYVHQLALRKGYRWSVVQCTGRYSQQIFEKLNYTLYHEVEYDAFRFGGRRPLAGLKSVDGSRRERTANGYYLDLQSLPA
ncbi:MAG: GNAT family N-acetyltransferase [Myxococcota bacterium]